MDLTQLKPKETKFKLKLANRSFTMRPITLNDEIWLAETYGESIQQVFETINIKEISRIVFRLLRDEDKAFFETRTTHIVNEKGDKETLKLGGIDLFRYLVSGWEEKVMLLNKLMENIGYSRPQIEQLQKGESAEEKKSLLTGMKSLMRSRASTDGQTSTY